jgi:multidrug transporter EmrE-like cation transporter
MSPTVIPLPPTTHKPFTRAQSVGLFFLCTVFGAAAQILMKTGMGQQNAHLEPEHASSYLPFVLALAMNLPLIAGYVLYGLNTVMLVMALRDGQLSVLYPIIALTYVWVTMLSKYFFHENVGVLKVCGIAVIVAGVAYLGRAGNR